MSNSLWQDYKKNLADYALYLWNPVGFDSSDNTYNGVPLVKKKWKSKDNAKALKHYVKSPWSIICAFFGLDSRRRDTIKRYPQLDQSYLYDTNWFQDEVSFQDVILNSIGWNDLYMRDATGNFTNELRARWDLFLLLNFLSCCVYLPLSTIKLVLTTVTNILRVCTEFLLGGVIGQAVEILRERLRERLRIKATLWKYYLGGNPGIEGYKNDEHWQAEWAEASFIVKAYFLFVQIPIRNIKIFFIKFPFYFLTLLSWSIKTLCFAFRSVFVPNQAARLAYHEAYRAMAERSPNNRYYSATIAGALFALLSLLTTGIICALALPVMVHLALPFVIAALAAVSHIPVLGPLTHSLASFILSVVGVSLGSPLMAGIGTWLIAHTFKPLLALFGLTLNFIPSLVAFVFIDALTSPALFLVVKRCFDRLWNRHLVQTEYEPKYRKRLQRLTQQEVQEPTCFDNTIAVFCYPFSKIKKVCSWLCADSSQRARVRDSRHASRQYDLKADEGKWPDRQRKSRRYI
jgi:hypothetical protein